MVADVWFTAMSKLWLEKLTFLFMSSPPLTRLRRLFWVKRAKRARRTNLMNFDASVGDDGYIVELEVKRELLKLDSKLLSSCYE